MFAPLPDGAANPVIILADDAISSAPAAENVEKISWPPDHTEMTT